MNIWPFSAINSLKKELASTENSLRRARATARNIDSALDQQIDRNNALQSKLELQADLIGGITKSRADTVIQLGDANDRAFRASEAHVTTMGHFHQALDLLAKIVKSTEAGRILDAVNEAEDFHNHHRGTKLCIKCGSDMIPMHSEDKKLCSNGACGHEIEWKLEDGQQYQYKRNVEAFIEDRSGVQEDLPPLERL